MKSYYTLRLYIQMVATVYLMYKLSTESKWFRNFTHSHMNIYSPSKNQPERTFLMSLSTGSKFLVCPSLVAAWTCETTLYLLQSHLYGWKNPSNHRYKKCESILLSEYFKQLKVTAACVLTCTEIKGWKHFFQPKKISGNTKDTLKGSFISLIPFHRHILKIDKCHKYQFSFYSEHHKKRNSFCLNFPLANEIPQHFLQFSTNQWKIHHKYRVKLQ